MTGKGMTATLKEKGLKLTLQRLAIIDALEELKSLHPSAHQVYHEAKKRNNSVSLSTVYATLSEFSRRGIIRTLEFDQMENRYELNMEEHVNLICSRCGKIVDYTSPIVFDQKELAEKTGFRVLHSRMEYHGLCRACLEESSSEKGLIAPTAAENR